MNKNQKKKYDIKNYLDKLDRFNTKDFITTPFMFRIFIDILYNFKETITNKSDIYKEYIKNCQSRRI